MIFRRIVLGTTAFFLLSALVMNEASSADANKRFSVRGLGTNTCSKYLEDRNGSDAKEMSDRYADWFMGFLTAYNWLKADTYDISAQYKTTGLLRYLDLQCGRSPKSKIIDAATSLVNAIYGKRQKTGS